MDINHTEKIRGYRIDIIRDEDCATPREDTQNGVMATRENNDRERPEPNAPAFPPIVTCPTCKGKGYPVAIGDGPFAPLCPDCDGEGTREARTWAEVVAWAKREHGATTVLALDGPNDWAGRYSVMPNPDIYGLDMIDGAIFDTAATRAETGTEPEQMAESLALEIDEYNDWADGNCWGYRVTDVNGEVVESCWGMIGDPDGYVLDAARAAVPDTETEKLIAVRLTRPQWAVVLSALGHSHSSGWYTHDGRLDWAAPMPVDEDGAAAIRSTIVSATN